MKIILNEKQLKTVIDKLTIIESTKPKTRDDIKKFQLWVINTIKDKKILGNGGNTGFGDDGMSGTKTDTAWQKYGSRYQPDKKDSSKSVNPFSTSINDVYKVLYNKLTKGKSLDINSSLTFNGSTLNWISNGAVVNSWPATSGVNLLNAEPKQWLTIAKNIFSSKQEKSKIKNFGPTPEGNYYIGKLQTSKLEKTNPFMDLVKYLFKSGQSGHDWNKNTSATRISWGYYRAAITPKGGTKTYGRGDFYIHGGLLPASHGCIDLTSNMEDFAKFYSSWATKFKKSSIPLNVKYSSSFLNIV